MSEQKKESRKTYEAPSFLEAARKGHLAAPKNDPQFEKDADEVSKRLGRKK
ncbi:MAG: hypothetical protein WC369_00060 [Dehalococcoidales bacterium]|jgi:hypothetical protein